MSVEMTPRERVETVLNLEVPDKDLLLRVLEERFADNIKSRQDGISVAFDDCWFNVRKSNTEPLLRIRLEAVDRTSGRKRREEIENCLRERGLLA